MANRKPGRPPVKRKISAAIVSEAERLRQAEMLLSISRKTAALETLDEVLESLVEMTTWELGAERGTLFLNDVQTGELYSRVAMGNYRREIRLLNTSGVAGHVFSKDEAVIIHDAYSDERFNRAIDQQTGYLTKSILCVPIKTVKGEVIGVAQVLNKKKGRFSTDDQRLLESMATQAAVSLQNAQYIERMKKSRAQELKFLDVVADLTSNIDLKSLLSKVMSEATRMLNAERSTLFLNDEKTHELWSEVGEGLDRMQIRFPNHLGIAGAVFSSGKTINIPYAYADLRFNPTVDKKTGFFTRSILCVPVVNKAGKTIGVTQVLNKRGGPFTDEDESRLRAFTAQISIGLENAKLFDDIQNMKNYNESILESMSSAVVTLDEDAKVITCNAAGLRIMEVEPKGILNRPAKEFFCGPNAWILEKLQKVTETRTSDIAMDAEMQFGERKLSVNLTIMPLISVEKKKLGTMIMIEDISTEKRMKQTMSKYMDPGLAGQLLEGDENILGGKSTRATVLFSDIRGFTTLTEEFGAQGTVALLNEYFTIMVEVIQREEGMLDKFIGDAIMAAFGIPLPHADDEDRAVRAAIAMINELDSWNCKRMVEGKKPIQIGIGLNTDVIVSGNIGSPKRMDYTMIGDGVNLASRLEGACKQYFTRILVSENTYRKLKGTYRSREVDLVQVKGKTEPVAIHEILDYHTDETFPNIMEVLNHFKSGLKLYRETQFEKAAWAFNEALSLNPEDRLSRMYIERCRYLLENPPCGEWNGVCVMTSK